MTTTDLSAEARSRMSAINIERYKDPAEREKQRERAIEASRQHGGTTWTPEEDADLTRLWGEGRTGTEIAAVLKKSKNACVGRAHRLKLPARPSPIKHQRAYGAARVAARAASKSPARANGALPAAGTPRPARPPRVSVPAVFQYPPEPSTNGASLKFCNWPRWERRDDPHEPAHYCGAEQDPGDPQHRYCPYHRLVSAVGEEQAARIAGGENGMSPAELLQRRRLPVGV